MDPAAEMARRKSVGEGKERVGGGYYVIAKMDERSRKENRNVLDDHGGCQFRARSDRESAPRIYRRFYDGIRAESSWVLVRVTFYAGVASNAGCFLLMENVAAMETVRGDPDQSTSFQSKHRPTAFPCHLDTLLRPETDRRTACGCVRVFLPLVKGDYVVW